jgi:L-asparaginase
METQIDILIIYTGGTIGMIKDPGTGALTPFNFEDIYEQIPVLRQFPYNLDFYCFDKLIDSSNMSPSQWVEIAEIIERNYENYDGFVVLHGSDTMSYTASALSFMLENLNKPVIFTGSQLPLGVLRTDGRENLIASIEIAAAKEDDTPVVPEVCIYFENKLMRANRTLKYNAENFNAFVSPNYPDLAEAGVYIKYNKNSILKPNFKKLKVHKNLDTNIAVLRMFPGIEKNVVKTIFNIKGLKAVILETFGSGNVMTGKWFLEALEDAVNRGILLVNVTQCARGKVEQGKYETSAHLKDIGVISGYDSTTEAMITKLMFLLGLSNNDNLRVKKQLNKSLRGEISL